MKRFLFFIVLMPLPILWLMNGCSGFESAVKNTTILGSEDIEAGVTNQAPKIKCDLRKNNNGVVIRTIDTISDGDTFTENFVQNDVAQFDCARTEDESSIEDISFYIDQEYDASAPQFVPVNGHAFELQLNRVGRFPVAIRAVDAQGKERLKTFTLVIECINPPTPILNNLSAVTVSSSGRLNYFNYSINPAAVSGGQGFEYSWDFNGDGTFDQISTSNGRTYWTAASSINNIYNIFATERIASRKINIKIKNNCEKESLYAVPVTFTMPNIARTAAARAEERAYYYIQADVRGNPTTNQRTNADVLVTKYADDPVRYVKCDYKKPSASSNATFSITGSHQYIEGEQYVHGLHLKLSDIPDTNAMGLQEFNSTSSSMKIDASKYMVSSSGDGLVYEEFNKTNSSNCQVNLRIRRSVAVSPCANNPSQEAETVTILGEYSCNPLSYTSNGSTKSVNVENGKFFCEVSKADQCIGGGGGGGGQPPFQQ